MSAACALNVMAVAAAAAPTRRKRVIVILPLRARRARLPRRPGVMSNAESQVRTHMTAGGLTLDAPEECRAFSAGYILSGGQGRPHEPASIHRGIDANHKRNANAIGIQEATPGDTWAARSAHG